MDVENADHYNINLLECMRPLSDMGGDMRKVPYGLSRCHTKRRMDG